MRESSGASKKPIGSGILINDFKNGFGQDNGIKKVIKKNVINSNVLVYSLPSSERVPGGFVKGTARTFH